MSTPGGGAVVVEVLLDQIPGEGMLLVRRGNQLVCVGGPSNDARVQVLEAAITAREQELEALTAKEHEAVEDRKLWEQQHGVQWERAEAAEAEAARWKAVAADMKAALQTSIERTDEDLQALQLAKVIVGTHNVNVARVNRANALLERAASRIDEVNCPLWWKAYRDHLAEIEATRAVEDLAAQPATSPVAPWPEQRTPSRDEVLARFGAGQPATAPSRIEQAVEAARTEAEDTPEEYDRLEAEQRVLDASRDCPEHRLREVIEALAPSNPFRRHAEAELARRGLKP